jgi:hypothetical protein
MYNKTVSPPPTAMVVVGEGAGAGSNFGQLLVQFFWCSSMQLLRAFWWLGMSWLSVWVVTPRAASQAKCPAMMALIRPIFQDSVAQLSLPEQL